MELTQDTKTVVVKFQKYNTMSSFYCQNKCGRDDFDIEKWNEQFRNCLSAGIEMPKNKICDSQCFECIAIVGETRIKNRKNYGRISKSSDV